MFFIRIQNLLDSLSQNIFCSHSLQFSLARKYQVKSEIFVVCESIKVLLERGVGQIYLLFGPNLPTFVAKSTMQSRARNWRECVHFIFSRNTQFFFTYFTHTWDDTDWWMVLLFAPSVKSVRRSPVTLQTNRYVKEPKTKSRLNRYVLCMWLPYKNKV